jgi:hypothetical protein
MTLVLAVLACLLCLAGLPGPAHAAGGAPVVTAPESLGCAGQPLIDTHFSAISFSTTTPQLIVAGVANQKVLVCAISLTAPNVNVALIEGTTTTNPCDTGTAGMAGGTTAATGWQFGNPAAPGIGIDEGNGYYVRYRTATAGDNVCLAASSNGQVSGSIVWVRY